MLTMGARIVHSLCGLCRAVVLGMCLFGIPLAFYGAWDAWVSPVQTGKSHGTKSIVGRTTECFGVGVFIGGIAGAIAGIGVAAGRASESRKH